MDRQWIKDLQLGKQATVEAAIAKWQIQKKQNGEPFLTLELCDRTGRISAIWWGAEPARPEGSPPPRFVRVRGNVVEWQGGQQIKLSAPPDPLESPANLADLLPASPLDALSLRMRLTAHIASVSDGRLRALLQELFVRDDSLRASFEEHPAACGQHHAYGHGLLEHTLEVADFVAGVCDAQRAWAGRSLNRDMAVTGALIHDIGKIEEMRREGALTTYTDPGNLLGHIMLGAVRVARAIARLRKAGVAFSTELEHLVLHFVASHHGRGEWRSPVAPATPEALLVHVADKFSADLYCMREVREANAGVGAAFVKQRKLDSGYERSDGRWVWVGEIEPEPQKVEAITEPSSVYAPPVERGLPILRILITEDLAPEPATVRRLPLYGRIAAGAPILNSDLKEGEILVDAGETVASGEHYLLRVKGDSMTGDGIQDGDLLVIRHQERADPGDIIVAVLDDEGATVKRLDRQADGAVFLLPSNPAHPPIPVLDPRSLRIQGKAVAIARG